MAQRQDSTDVDLAASLADAAVKAIETTVETHYTHVLTVDAKAGIYDVDCSGFVSVLLGQVASRHLAMLTETITGTRPLAHDYYEFAAALPPAGRSGWRPVEQLASARPGDIVAWKLPAAKTGDTGHVFVVAAPAVPVADDESQSVAVYDATAILHFDDTRGPGKAFATGIGSGAIHFRTDAHGKPVAFRFDPRTRFETIPIAIARIERFSAG